MYFSGKPYIHPGQVTAYFVEVQKENLPEIITNLPKIFLSSSILNNSNKDPLLTSKITSKYI